MVITAQEGGVILEGSQQDEMVITAQEGGVILVGSQ